VGAGIGLGVQACVGGGGPTGLGDGVGGGACHGKQPPASTSDRRSKTSGVRRATANLPAEMIILGPHRCARGAPRRYRVAAYKNDSPSSLGSRRRENERRKKTYTADCLHDTAFCSGMLDGNHATSLRFPAKSMPLPCVFPTIALRPPWVASGSAAPAPPIDLARLSWRKLFGHAILQNRHNWWDLRPLATVGILSAIIPVPGGL
jgi:hypothetical protein